MAEEFKDGLEHLPLPERVALRAEALADLAAKVRAGWRDADQQHARDVELLLWLHAEAAWQREQAVMAEALRWRKIVEQWEQGHQNEVLPYTAKLEAEVAGLKAAIADIDAHATRVGLLHNDDPEGSPHHYLLTVGALHRALGKAYTAEPCESERARLRVESARSEASRQAWAEEALRVDPPPATPDDIADIVGEFGNLNTFLTEQVTEKLFEFYDFYPKPLRRSEPLVKYVCACSIDAEQVVAAGPLWVRPQCAVHPDGQGGVQNV